MVTVSIAHKMLKVRPRRLVVKRPSAVRLAANGGQTSPKVSSGDVNKLNSDIIKIRLNLLEKICSTAYLVKQQIPEISNFNEFTRYALNAAASSIILIDFNKKELHKFTDSPLGRELKQMPMSDGADITRWIMENDKPMIINNNHRENTHVIFKDEVSGIESRTIACVPLIINGHVKGMIKTLNKLDGSDFNERDLETLKGLSHNAVMTLENIWANETALYSVKDNLQKMVSLVDPKENAASRHAVRVAEYALIGATELALSDEMKRDLAYAGILHDIGLLSIPESIINKTTALTREEQYIIRKHSIIGYNLIQRITSLSEVSKLILYHHERFDGKGYPCGLKGNTIPLSARLLAVAEAFASMREKHSYRMGIFAKDALEELNKYVGGLFCPVAAKAFIVGYIKSHSLGKVTVKRSSPA